MNKPELVKSLIEKSLNDAHVEILSVPGMGDGDHIGLLIASDVFAGKSRLEQHKVIMDILKDELVTGRVHAVKLKTMTKEKYQQSQQG